MKRGLFLTFIILVAVLFSSSCGNPGSSADPLLPQAGMNEDDGTYSSVTPDDFPEVDKKPEGVGYTEDYPELGSTEHFVCGELELQISNVREIISSEDYDTYVVYPGAKVTIINPGYEAEGPPGEEIYYPDWLFYFQTGERLEIVEGMEPVLITEDIRGIVDEGYVPLQFKIYEETSFSH